MAAENTMASIDRVIERYERRLSAARAIRELLADDTEFAIELLEQLACKHPEKLNGNACLPANSLESASATHLERITSILRQNGNNWLSTPEIVKLTKLSRGSVGAILHNLHKDKFEKRKKLGSEKVKEWRLVIKGGEHE